MNSSLWCAVDRSLLASHFYGTSSRSRQRPARKVQLPRPGAVKTSPARASDIQNRHPCPDAAFTDQSPSDPCNDRGLKLQPIHFEISMTKNVWGRLNAIETANGIKYAMVFLLSQRFTGKARKSSRTPEKDVRHRREASFSLRQNSLGHKHQPRLGRGGGLDNSWRCGRDRHKHRRLTGSFAEPFICKMPGNFTTLP